MNGIMQSVEEPGSGNAAAAAPESDNNGLGWHRGPKPEMAYQCRNLDDVLAAVQYEVQTHCKGLIPEEVSCRLQFPVAAALEYPKIRDAETAARPLSKCTNEAIDPDPCSGYSVAAALSNFFDAKEKLQYQRVVARTIIAAIGAADGFKYSERRASDTAKGDGYRFSYVYRDSLQNKDRRVNRGQVDGEVVGPDGKETFDCKGGLRVTFSIKNLSIDVWYHHLPVHNSSYEIEKAKEAQRNQERLQTLASNQSRSTQETTSSEWPMLGNPYGTEAIQGHQPTAETPSSIAPKKKRGRPKKASGGSAPIFNGPPSSQDTRGLDTLVNAITADMNGGTSIDNSQPGISPSKPRKKTKTREATQLQAPSWTANPASNPYSAPQPPPAPAAEASSSAASPEKPKHTRKKTGCLTCRARKVGCDEQRPTCAMCAIKGRECSWAAMKDDKKKSRERVIARIQAGDWHQRNKADKSKKNAK